MVLYRGACFYGATRWIAWLIWAHVVHDYGFDLSWGGPGWIFSCPNCGAAREPARAAACLCCGCG